MPVAEIAMLIGGATKAFKMCKAAVNAGRDLEDMGRISPSFLMQKQQLTKPPSTIKTVVNYCGQSQ